MRTFTATLCTLVFACSALFAGAAALAEEFEREEHTVSVLGVQETWRLVWEGKPSNICSADDINQAFACPCTGFAYGEYGKLFLLRSRNGREVERFALAPLFENAEHPWAGENKSAAYLQKWPLESGDFDRDRKKGPTLIAEIRHRPTTKVLQFGNYDRDPGASEFLIRVGNEPCGKGDYVAVGVSSKKPKLHVLSSTARPDTPLAMSEYAWKALLDSPGNHTVITWSCGDHGSEVYDDAVISSSRGHIRIKNREFSCTTDGRPGKLLSQTDG